MKSLFTIVFSCICFIIVLAQNNQPGGETSKAYRESYPKINDLVHTKLEVSFDFSKAYMYGKEWLTLKPHFYSTDSLLLDAKAMEIKQVAIVKSGKNVPLKYHYNGLQLNIDLDRNYKGGEQYTLYIDYTAKPDEYNAKGSAAITGAKGLYFINPRDEEKNKPTQIWTQGETESNSVWMPTIDKPNQKTTEEIYMTVPGKYVTLSNGKLMSQKKNSDGTRTDYWKMDLPHAPYLFFMGVGEYAIIKDNYKGKEVSYYVEKEYAPVARKIFGRTPEMIALYSKLTGVDYPWIKYSQIVGRDYVSGAMENTTVTLHQEAAYQDARELIDDNRWEGVIAHELFHQWFGDLVTTESWSNISLNESFATIGSQLWNEFGNSKDEADAERYNSAQGYINSRSENKDLIRFYYNDKEDVFDAVSYNKGAAILQMLRNYIGDSAFFKSLRLYLNNRKFKSAEAHDLRLAFEEITGKDLNWFFNQWYFSSGHPKLDITYSYSDKSKQAQVIVKQNTDKIFRLPVAIDVYTGSNKSRHNVWVQSKIDTFNFSSATKPDLINFDGDKILLAEKKENKNLDEYYNQYVMAGTYIDRREAIDAAAKEQEKIKAVDILMRGLRDKYHGIRSYTINKLDFRKEPLKAAAEPLLFDIAKNDPKSIVRAAAIAKLGDYKKPLYATLFKNAIKDSSYSVSGSALEALYKIDSTAAVTEAKRLSATAVKGRLASIIKKIAVPVNGNKLLSDFEKLPVGQQKFMALEGVFDFLEMTNSVELFKRGVDDILQLEKDIPEAFREQATAQLNAALREVQNRKADNAQKDMADYIESKLGKKEF
ncbi:MAG: M1 family metallopeptidase [Chitinophagaceae bacterium]|nr:M1 family metallopeptidase [Chitinophagaceae bacterium]